MFPILTPIIETTNMIIRATRDAIKPFTETPPTEKMDEEVKVDSLRATDLFSHFTANIIREEVVFTR